MGLNEWWSEHGETVWATVAALVIAVAVGYYFWRKSEKPMHLGWELLTNDRIVQVDQAKLHPQQLKLTVNDVEVDQPNLAIVRVGNSGRREIRQADFDGDVNVTFNQAKLKTVTVTGWSDPRMAPVLSTHDDVPNRVSLRPLLLNPGDWIDIQCVTDGPLEAPSISARIAGESKPIASVVKPAKSDKHKSRNEWLTHGAVAVFFVVAYEYLVFYSGHVHGITGFGFTLVAVLPLFAGAYFGYSIKPLRGHYSEVWKQNS